MAIANSRPGACRRRWPFAEEVEVLEKVIELDYGQTQQSLTPCFGIGRVLGAVQFFFHRE